MYLIHPLIGTAGLNRNNKPWIFRHYQVALILLIASSLWGVYNFSSSSKPLGVNRINQYSPSKPNYQSDSSGRDGTFVDTGKAVGLRPIARTDSKTQSNVSSEIVLLIKKGNYSNPPDTAGAFVHIGKTGGSTISKYLQNGCHSFVRKPCKEVPEGLQTPISRLTTYIHVPDFPKILDPKRPLFREYLFYVFSVRDPFDRAISAFLYALPQNVVHMSFVNKIAAKNMTPSREEEQQMKAAIQARLKQDHVDAYQCFPTLQVFADRIGYNASVVNATTPWRDMTHAAKCTDIARLAINHQVKGMIHLFWDLTRVIEAGKDIFDRNTIFAVRTSSLWHDFNKVNQLLGQEHSIDTSKYTKHVRDASSNPVGKDLNVVGREKLCYAVEPHYDTYFNVLSRSLNIDQGEFEQSLGIARSNCPCLDFTKYRYSVIP